MKSDRTHIIPLTPQTRAILTEAKQWSGASELVLPGKLHGERVQSENTYNKALRTVLPKLGFSEDAHVAHGFRRTASTALNEANWNRDWVEMQLAHWKGGVREVYNAAKYLPARRRMLAWYNEWLDNAALGVPTDPPAWLADRADA